jgi:3-deoxy-D-manno-octulosonic-acid transferase
MGLFLGLLLYNIILTMAFLLGWPYLLICILMPGNKKWRQRCGLLPVFHGNPIWLHAASMGEAALISPLAEVVKIEMPGKEMVVSTMTETGQKRADKINGGIKSFFLPLDFLFSLLISLNRVKPSMLVLMETELWPNLIWLCWLKGIPVVIVNARLSNRSLPAYRLFGFLFRPLLNKINLISCQSEEYAVRYKSLGIKPEIILNGGNLKYDTIRKPVTTDKKKELKKQFGFKENDPIFVAGSTREGEEGLIIESWFPLSKKMRMIIAPRHPDRFLHVEEILAEKKISFIKRSQMSGSEPSGDVLLLDTMGELIDAYSAGDIAFVGGSLVPVGGHNPLEPAALGLPVIFGPHMYNAQESAQSLLLSKGAFQVSNAGELRACLEKVLSDRSLMEKYGNNARQVVEQKRGAAATCARKIKTIITDNC